MKEAIQRKEDKNKQNDPLQRRAEEDAVQMKEMSPPPFSLDAAPAQMKGEEEEEATQLKSAAPAQMKGEEEEESLQMKAAPAQMKSEEEEEKA